VIAGLLVMMIVVSSIQWMGLSWFPPEVFDSGSSETRLAVHPVLPAGALLMELLSLAVGSFLGAGTAATVSKQHKLACAILIGVVMLGLVGIKLLVFPHSLWVAIAAVLIPIPSALGGWRVFR